MAPRERHASSSRRYGTRLRTCGASFRDGQRAAATVDALQRLRRAADCQFGGRRAPRVLNDAITSVVRRADCRRTRVLANRRRLALRFDCGRHRDSLDDQSADQARRLRVLRPRRLSSATPGGTGRWGTRSQRIVDRVRYAFLTRRRMLGVQAYKWSRRSRGATWLTPRGR
jgi:hypothetical protein